ncbi:LamB/YcsF family protein [Virgibacillus necropolis]|uniref:5-oxoprolinase subunit A n=1 Tax=Virgibacillus necropolis TaxID=163877 RepID=A0A221MFS3_9BACI|nr:5-oxoprolinase subunit PxpA [Virgibacillus necropolis]ASN06518.1 lactam utilization protein LamB [Virgibacillus necropolis]
MRTTIDLNCDMGESFGVYKLGYDDDVIKLISSVNIACGFHGGDHNIMNHTVAMAKKYGVGVGAHPGFLDLHGFGRRNIDVGREDLMNSIIYQIGALYMFCQKHDVELRHVKPHGNMNNMADKNKEMAVNIVDAIRAVDKNLPILVKPNSQLHLVAKDKGLPFVLELFADRAYNDDISLVSRKYEGAVISDPEKVAKRVIKMVTEKKITTINGEEIEVDGESICVHGDTPTALDMIRIIKERLEGIGVKIAPLSVN